MSRQKNYLCYNELKAGIECCYGWQWAAFYPEVDQRIEEVLQKFGAAWDVGIGSFEALSLEDDDFLTELRDHAPGKAAALLKRVARIWGVPERKLATLERSVFPLHSLRQYVVEDEQELLKAMLNARKRRLADEQKLLKAKFDARLGLDRQQQRRRAVLPRLCLN